MIVHQYSFELYAPEPEWTIDDVTIPYLYKGKKLLARAPTVTFFVRPHLTEEYKLSDFPGAYSFPPGLVPNSAPTPSIMPLQWFTPLAQLMGGLTTMKYVVITMMSAMMFGLLFVGFVLARSMRANGQRRKVHIVVWSDDDVLRELERANSATLPRDILSKMHDVLSMMLHQYVSEISERNATFQQWKEHVVYGENHPNISTSIAPDDVAELFDMLEQRNDRNFSGNDKVNLGNHVAEVASRIRQLGTQLRVPMMEREHAVTS